MKASLTISVVLLASVTGLGAQDRLTAAKDLYASAAYEDALSALSGMDADSAAPDISRQANEYRAFCLYALGRTTEAESVAEAMIKKEPLARLNADDASPRLVLMFSDVRKRLLPSLIRTRFRTARAAVDLKKFGEAEQPLTEARLMIAEAEKLGVKDDGLGDLSVLVDGFLQLIQSAADQQAIRQPATVSPAAAPVSSPVSAPAAAAVGSSRVYTAEDEGVTPPVTIEQRIPAMPVELLAIIKSLHNTGILDVLIDETGRVAEATIRQSLNVGFDTIVVKSAQRWKYRPATKNGVPVRYLKSIVLAP
jgi:hypothetical protein